MDTSKFSIWEFFSLNHLEVFPIPAFPPYAVQTLHFMEAPIMESITRLWEASHALDVLHGGLGDSNLDRAGSSRNLARHLAAKAARMPPKRREGAEQRRAREATHTVAWRTCTQISRAVGH